MSLWRVQTDTWTSNEYESLDLAMLQFEKTKDREIGEGVTEDSYVELVVSHDNFDDYHVIKRVNAIIDEERMEKEGSPDEQGYDFQWWAKWQEVTA